jgi:hypothetical protein
MLRLKLDDQEANTDAPAPVPSETAMSSEEGKNIASKQKERKSRRERERTPLMLMWQARKFSDSETMQGNGAVSTAAEGAESAIADADLSEKKKQPKKNQAHQEKPSAGISTPSWDSTGSTTSLQKAPADALSSGSSINSRTVVEKAQISAQDVLDLLVVGKGKKSGYTLELAAVSQ